MATSEVTPQVTTASEAPSAAPASTPSTSSAPVTSTPATTTTETPKMNPGESELSFLRRVREQRNAAEAAKPEAKPEAVVEPKKEENKPEVLKTDEKVNPEATKTEDAKPAEAATEELEPELSLEDQAGPLPPQELAQKFKENPELEAALTKAGIDKNAVFAMSRLAAKAAKFGEIFMDVDQARFASQQADTFAKADDLFTDIGRAAASGGDPSEAVDNFVGLLMELDMARDEAGNPLKDEKGAPVLQGNAQAFVRGMEKISVENFVRAISSQGANVQNEYHRQIIKSFADGIRKEGETKGDEELTAVADILESRVKGSAPEELPQAIRDKETAINAEKEALNRQREADAEAQHQQFENAIRDTSKERYVTMIDKLLGQTDLDDDDKQTAKDRIIEGLAERLSSDPKYKAEREALLGQYNDQTKTKRIGLNERYGKAILKSIAEPVFKKLGAKILSKQEAKQTKINAQIEASKAEPKGSTASASPAAAVNPQEAVAKYVKEYVEKNGRQPDPLDVIKYRRSLAQG